MKNAYSIAHVEQINYRNWILEWADHHTFKFPAKQNKLFQSENFEMEIMSLTGQSAACYVTWNLEPREGQDSYRRICISSHLICLVAPCFERLFYWKTGKNRLLLMVEDGNKSHYRLKSSFNAEKSLKIGCDEKNQVRRNTYSTVV